MTDINKNVSDLIEDLNNKIDSLTNTDTESSEEALIKINEIKNKVINALKQAIEKVNDVTENSHDVEEIDKCIEIVKVKSKQLYDNAILRIDELVKQEYHEENEESKKIIDSARKQIDEFFENEEIKNAPNVTNTEFKNLNEKALATLTAWLKTEEK